MINWKTTSDSFVFNITHNNALVPLCQWSEHLPSGDGKFLLLQELLDNNQAVCDEYNLIVPHEEICDLEPIDQLLLELPQAYDDVIRIDSEGTLNEPSFKFRYGFYKHAIGEQLQFFRQGAMLVGTSSSYLLSGKQLVLCDQLDKFNNLSTEAKNNHSNLFFFHGIKQLANQANAIMDDYLREQNVVVPKEIRLRLELDDDVLSVSPEIQGVDSTDFTTKFTKFPGIRPTYTIQEESGKRNRVVFSDKQQQQLKKIKHHSKTTGAIKQQILTNPQEFFDPDVIDLDSFSDRVVEIGCYEPRYYPFIRPNSKNMWIPGFIVEESPSERKQIMVSNKNELNELKQSFSEAESNQESMIIFKGAVLPIKEARELIALVEQQMQDPSKPLKKLDQIQGAHKVLIIKENIEDVEYDKNIIEAQRNITHTYSAPPNLLNGITILEHQQEGIAWLQSLYNLGCSGALLADDMGLGKTLQVLSFVDWHSDAKNRDKKPYLVVSPVALLENWEDEYYKFFNKGSLEVLKCYGKHLKTSLVSLKSPYRPTKAKLVLTTYETLRRQQLKMCQLDWSVVILDEAQKIKTPGTLVTNAAKAIKADFKIAVTGTPVENTLVDLWCIMDFAVPGLLGSARDFSRHYQSPLNSLETDVQELGENLRQRIGDQIKRRLKDQVLKGLPKKHLKSIEQPMPQVQFNRYQEIVNSAMNEEGEDEGSAKMLTCLKGSI